MKIGLCRQVFVRVETSRSHLAWSAVDRNLTFFGYQNKLVPILSQVRPGPYCALYNNQINARALIGQSAVGYCAGKPTEKIAIDQ